MFEWAHISVVQIYRCVTHEAGIPENLHLHKRSLENFNLKMGKLKKGKHALKEKNLQERFAKMSTEVSISMLEKHGVTPAMDMLAQLEILDRAYDLCMVNFRESDHRAKLLDLSLRNRFRVIEMYVAVKGQIPPRAMIMELHVEENNPIHTEQQYQDAIESIKYTNASIFVKNVEWSGIYVNDITGSVAGFILYRLMRTQVPVCHVEHLCVDAVHRGVGFARALIRRVELFVKFFALHRSDTVMTVRANKESLSLWRGFGFTEPENVQNLPCKFEQRSWHMGDIFLVKYPVKL